MPFISDNLDDVSEQQYIEKDGDYEFRIVDAEVQTTKAGDREMIVVTLKPLVDGEDFGTMREWLVLPNEEDRTVPNAGGGFTSELFLRKIKRFLYAFDITPDFDDPASEFPGHEGRGRVRMKARDDNPELMRAELSYAPVPKDA